MKTACTAILAAAMAVGALAADESKTEKGKCERGDVVSVSLRRGKTVETCEVAMTFDRTLEFVEACAEAGIGPAEFCLVGWNYRGHDGRYPQLWPVEPQLGGEDGLRHLISATQAKGFRIVLHNNHTDAYSVGEGFDLSDIAKKRTACRCRTREASTCGPAGRHTRCVHGGHGSASPWTILPRLPRLGRTGFTTSTSLR